MNAAILDTSNILRLAAPGGAVVPAAVAPDDGPQAANTPSFNAALKLLFGQAQRDVSNVTSADTPASERISFAVDGDGVTDALETLKVRLTEVLNSVQTAGSLRPDSEQLQALVADITSALEEFEAASGLNLVAAVQPYFTQPEMGEALGTSEQNTAGDVSGLIGLVDIVLQVAQSAVPVNTPSSPSAPTSTPLPLPPVPLQTVATPMDVEAVAQTARGVDAPATDPAEIQIAASVTQRLVENTQTAASAKSPDAPVTEPVKIQIVAPAAQPAVDKANTAPTTNTPDAPVTDQAEIQIAASVAQRVVDKAKTTPSATKSTQEFVAAVASGQSVLQAPAQPFAAVFPMMEAELRSNLPQQETLFAVSSASASAAPDEAKAVQDAPKPSRFTGMILEQIKAARISEGLTKVELSPRGLGAVEIEVTSDSNGVTNVVVRAENTMVLNALREMREPWAQIPALQDAGSLSFEDMPHRQDGDGEEHSGYVGSADDQDATAAQNKGPANAPVIIGNQLDLTT